MTIPTNKGGSPTHRGGTSTAADLNRYRSVVSLDGRAMCQLVSLAAFYSLRTKTKVSYSVILRRAVDLLAEHILPLVEKPSSNVDVLIERNLIREARVTREGEAGWSLDSRTERLVQGRPSAQIDMEQGDQAEDDE